MQKLFRLRSAYLLILCFFTFAWTSDVDATAFQFDRKERVVDFGLLYPVTFLKGGIERRNRDAAAGIHFNYQFFVTDHVAILVYPNAWFTPVLIQEKKAMIYSINLETGLAYRFFPGSFLDPSLYVSGGIAAMNAGKQYKGKIAFPVSSHLGFNLWRQTDRFQDFQLAFHAFVGARHYFRVIDAIRPTVLDFGVAFRGSF